ncbi:MAG: glutamine--fructose-6-phosphate transaminase (isomerizing) [Candidatus Omnitrophica bacterium]|nr:glutamine--fructose-6-phosphate transaminase (isomerizing) [Candidatus Omnitrophota bacterium]MBU2251024.1 glutamine--fructose-6-phosphate transaminase (isomerizing) [Candidatus Omnitrophota bacterium]MBU2473218.1 glutamine--fructose-6-phosphate transaminase (isomerizing) [Candidatus Omnitrophota bacterium]
MCGIFGYVGSGLSFSELVYGLSRLEYRGYDSCGIASLDGQKLFLKKRAGKINQLRKDLKSTEKKVTSLALLHTRWATHGEPNWANCHPHLDCEKKIVVAHNGIIENFLELKQSLIKKGHRFSSQTDSEVIAHLIEEFYKNSLLAAVVKTVKELKGSFALGIASLEEPDKIIAVRQASPLIVGTGPRGNFLTSDLPAILNFAQKAAYLDEQQIAVITSKKINVFNFKSKPVRLRFKKVDIKPEEAGKKGYEHFMLKEINEQPAVLKRLLSVYSSRGKVSFPGLGLKDGYLKKVKKVYITACGTAYHAGYAAKYFLEKYCRISVEIDTSSEFRYRSLALNQGDLLIAISQSGETADTLAAVRQAKKEGAKVLSVCNVLGSSLAKESHGIIPTLAGPEIGVASTKAYTAQIFCLYLFCLYLGRIKGSLKTSLAAEVLKELRRIPHLQETILRSSLKVKKIAGRFSKFGSFLFLGRGINYPSALEGALKLKEISYIPAEGYPAGEMKHGPIALIDEYRAVVCIAVQDELYEKMFSNVQEIKARKGKVLAILNPTDSMISTLSDAVIYLPGVVNPDLNPLLVAVATQLFAYFVAKNLGCEIDQPRNLAKSVTVE